MGKLTKELIVKRLLVAVAFGSALAGLGGTALAADVMAAPTYDWSGYYLGVQAGYAWGNSTSHAFGNLGPGTVSSASLDPDGGILGLYTGYNFQIDGNFLLGVDADINFANIKSDDVTIESGGVPLPGNTHSGEMDWNGSGRLRLGWAVDRFLPYVAGGIAFGNYQVDYNHSGASGSLDDFLVGWTVGGGAEYAFSDNVISRIEYRYTDYGSMDGSVFAAFPLETQDADLKTHEIRFGIAYKF